jgi:hypothetical protein
MVSFNNEVQITFPPLSNIPEPSKKSSPPAPGPWPVTRTASVHLISISAEAISQLDKVDYIGAFNSEGVCVGYAYISGTAENILLTIYGDDLMTDAKDGMEAGESISLRAFSYSSTKETPLQAEWNKAFANADGHFANEGLSQITAFKAEATAVSESNDLAQLLVYPNPAKDVVTITPTGFKTLSGLEGTLLTTDGRPVKTFNLTGEKTTVDISGFQPGVYLLVVKSGSTMTTHRLVITP